MNFRCISCAFLTETAYQNYINTSLDHTSQLMTQQLTIHRKQTHSRYINQKSSLQHVLDFSLNSYGQGMVTVEHMAQGSGHNEDVFCHYSCFVTGFGYIAPFIDFVEPKPDETVDIGL